MVCPKCQSNDVNVQIVNESQLANAHHWFLWWLCVGWWWILVKWFYFFWIALVFKIFGIGKKKKIKNITKKVYACQKCGHTWDA